MIVYGLTIISTMSGEKGSYAMCIDKLEIKFEELMGGLGHPLYLDDRINIEEGVCADPRRINIEDIRESLITAGYRLSDRSSGRGRNQYILLHVLDGGGEKLDIVLKAKNDTRRGRDRSYVYLSMIIANPSRFQRWRDFWSVMQAIDGVNGCNRVIERGYIQRIDYACDYRVPLQTIMRGLYVSRSQTLFAYDDFSDSDPYGEYRWNAGVFHSFKIGAGNKCWKVYDKGLEELKRLRRRESRLREQSGENVSTSSSNDSEEEEENNDYADFWEDGVSNLDFRTQLEAIRAEISQIQAAPRTRIELSIKTPAEIRRAWRYGSGRPLLSELPQHLDLIQNGHYTPFQGVLLHGIEMRGAHFLKRTLEAQRIRHEVDMGFLINVAKRMGRRFWTEHRRYFEIYPWDVRSQPTAIFKMRLFAWKTVDRGLISRGATVPPEAQRPASGQPQERQWPLDLTLCVADRMAMRNPPVDGAGGLAS